MRIGFLLNGTRYIIDLPPSTRLLEALRREFSITSVHAGCTAGACGSCLVLLNGQAVPSCIVPLFSCRDSVIETVEGMAAGPDIADIERGFQKAGLVPCNLCVNSKVVLAESLVRNLPDPDPASVSEAIPEHWCGCCSRDQFVDAVLACHDLRKKRKKHGQLG